SGGLFTFKREVFNYLPAQGDFSIEEYLAARLIKKNKLSLFVYDGYYSQIDSEREAEQLRNNAHVLGFPRQAKRRTWPRLVIQG
ncbi:unnamed protein product, partial [marine sediment metagenome]